MTENKNPKPSREPDAEEHGQGAPPDEVKARAEGAYFAELFIDALGDPEHAPLGWWHLKLWDGP
ncbi:hypothetical protein [Caulobacter rhizosphaerae]|uniref:hypothetical protein n=1 Tax=Caulobacter rhizosphaerae TaxID=2010972 RepID=UPI0013D32123|nr:hypothetical protein [Caulobacter rhizosphaerae]GGL48601.1 hypothetical protein GCM10010983_52410 [Caulobacter rhizosphaerae]